MESLSSRSSISSDLSDLPPDTSNLTPTQTAALAELHRLCAVRGVSWPAPQLNGRKLAPWNTQANDDITLLRYLRARDFVPEAAFNQYNATCAWRSKLALDDMYTHADIEHFEAISRLFPQWTGRRDKRGVPVFVFCVAKIRTEDLHSTAKADPSMSSVFLPAEYSTQFVQPLCARMHVDSAMPCAIQIIDLTGVKVTHFWKLRAHLQRASTMATAHYPESVDKIFILGAPSFFPTVWSFVTSWFEPNLTKKIFVLPPSEVKSTLTRYIAEEDLPKSMGGTLDWEYGCRPSLDEETKRLVGGGTAALLAGEGDWVSGPLKFVPAGTEAIGGEREDRIVAVGVEKSKRAGGARVAVLARMRVGDDVDSDVEVA